VIRPVDHDKGNVHSGERGRQCGSVGQVAGVDFDLGAECRLCGVAYQCPHSMTDRGQLPDDFAADGPGTGYQSQRAIHL
jgi:hypothetical protein